MNQLKYFNAFFEAEDKEEFEDPFPNEVSAPVEYDESDGSYTFEYISQNKDKFSLKVTPALDIFMLQLPAGGFYTAAFSSLHKTKDYLLTFDNGLLYSWLIRIIVNFKHRESSLDSTLKVL